MQTYGMTFKEIMETERKRLEKESEEYIFLFLFTAICFLTLLVLNIPVTKFSFSDGLGYVILTALNLFWIYVFCSETVPFIYKYIELDGKFFQTKVDRIFIAKEWLSFWSILIPVVIFTVLTLFWKEDMTFVKFLMGIAVLALIPGFSSAFDKRIESRIERKFKQKVTKRTSADGSVDLTNLPYLFTNINDLSIKSKNVNDKLVVIQEMIDYVTLNSHLLDIENNHIIKRIGEEEIIELMNVFAELEDNIQIELENEMLQKLSLIEKQLIHMKDTVREYKSSKIQKIFDVIDERYSNQ